MILDQPVERLDQRRHGEIARAHIDAERAGRLIAVGRNNEIGQQRKRQVVDGLVAHILEGLERGRAPGPRHAGYHDEPLAAGRFGTVFMTGPPARRRACETRSAAVASPPPMLRRAPAR